MDKRLSVGVIGGSGWIGRSFVHALLSTNPDGLGEVCISNTTGINPFAQAWPQVKSFTRNQTLVDAVDVLVVSVRPEQFESLSIQAPECLLISMMAGVPISRIKAVTGATQVIRAMPNAAMEIGRGYVPWCACADVTPGHKSFAQSLFLTSGAADEVSAEPLLEYLTGLSGTGPAYPALLAQALMDHACARGLPAHIAARAVNAVVVSASQLLSSHTSEQLIDALMSYQGVTAAGLTEMTAQGFKSAVAAGLDKAEARALQMMSR